MPSESSSHGAHRLLQLRPLPKFLRRAPRSPADLLIPRRILLLVGAEVLVTSMPRCKGRLGSVGCFRWSSLNSNAASFRYLLGSFIGSVSADTR